MMMAKQDGRDWYGLLDALTAIDHDLIFEVGGALQTSLVKGLTLQGAPCGHMLTDAVI